MMQDITEHKKAQEILQRNQKLESLGVLAGGIAHDFNNLLGGMFAYVDMAKISLTDNKPQQAYMELTKAFSVYDRTKALTQQLLTFAKGGAPLRTATSLGPIIKNCVQFSLSGSNIIGQCRIDDDLLPCLCDENQIGQVIDNIIINAKQAMPLGGMLLVTAKNVSKKPTEPKRTAVEQRQPGNFIQISIQDQGIGIAKEYISKIFDPFFTTKILGHGLGLATVYSIVNRHGGWIDVESVVGKGTTFHVYLPVSPDMTEPVRQSSSGMHTGSGAALVVDDEESLRETVAAMLKAMGYAVVVAQDGTEALHLFTEAHRSSTPFKLIILDLTIPGGMGGYETIQAIRPIDRDVAVIVASGYADDPVMADPIRYGFTAKIVKPFKRGELSDLLTTIFQQTLDGATAQLQLRSHQ